MWFSADNFVLMLAQAACVALPAAGVPRWTRRFGSRGWALVAPLSIALVIGGISLIPSAAQLLTWVALILVPLGAALAFGWAARGARPWLAMWALPLFAAAWVFRGDRGGDAAAAILIAGSAVTAGRLLAGVAPLRLLKTGVVVMAVVDSVLVFSGQLQGPNTILVAASPGDGLPHLQAAAFGSAGLGYGDLFAAAVVGGILAVERAPQAIAGFALLAVSLVWNQLFFAYDVLPATVPPALVLVAFDIHRLAVSKGCERLPAEGGLAR